MLVTIFANNVHDELYFLADLDNYAKEHYKTYRNYKLRYIEKLDIGCNWCGIYKFNNTADAIAFERYASKRPWTNTNFTYK